MMLRITQTVEAIEVAFRKREAYFSRDFFKGLGVALLFHCVLFIVFRIAALPNLDDLNLLTPIAVEIDLKRGEIELLPSPQNIPLSFEGVNSWHFIFHPLENASPMQNLYPLNKMEILNPSFSEIEKIEYHPLSLYLEEED